MNPFRWLYSQPYLLLFLATLAWAGNAVAGKMAVGHVSPFALTSLRWLVASSLLLPFAWQYLKLDWHKVRPHLLFLFVLGTIGFTVFNNLMYLALATTTAINAAIIQSSLPLFIFVLNYVFLSVNTTIYQTLGFPITLLGVIAITTHGDWTQLLAFQFRLGDLLMVAAVTAYGIYSVLLSKKPTIHWLSTLGVLSISAFISSLPFMLFEISSKTVVWPDLVGVSVIIYTAICASLLAQSFWIRGIELIGSNATSLFINLVPLLGTVLAILLLDEQLYAYHAAGMALILSGVLLAQKGNINKA